MSEETIQALIKALKALVAADNCNYLASTMRYEGLFEDARQALERVDHETP